MILAAQSDVGYLAEVGSRSRAEAHILLSKNDPICAAQHTRPHNLTNHKVRHGIHCQSQTWGLVHHYAQTDPTMQCTQGDGMATARDTHSNRYLYNNRVCQ
eukprot:CCRYP_008814-RC/>CCRYP_008814-RC protein AED:0.22 eAED:0.75 QI:0/-1/0/1/-1/0/1/0/100